MRAKRVCIGEAVVQSAMQSVAVWFIAVVCVLAMISLGVMWRAGWLRLARPVAGVTPTGPNIGVLALVMGVALWMMISVASALALFMVIAQQPGGSQMGSLSAAASGLPNLTFVEQAQMAAVTYAVGICASAVLWQAWRRRFEAAPTTPSIVRAMGIGVLAMVMAAPVVMVLNMLGQVMMTVVFGQPAPTLAHNSLAALADDTQPLLWRCVMIGVVVIGAPIVEEVLYRGFLQTSLTKLTGRPWVAIGITTAVFVVMHAGAIPADAWLPAGLTLTGLSLAMSIAFARTGRVTTSIIMHVLFNTANVAAALVLT